MSPNVAMIVDLTVRVELVDGLFHATVTGNQSGRFARSSNVLWSNAVLTAMYELSRLDAEAILAQPDAAPAAPDRLR